MISELSSNHCNLREFTGMLQLRRLIINLAPSAAIQAFSFEVKPSSGGFFIVS